MITIDVRHDGWGRFERVSAPTQAQAEDRAAALWQRWEDEYKRRAPVLTDAAGAFLAAERSADAARAVAALTSILFDAIKAPPVSGWAPLYDSSAYSEAAPVEPPPPQHESEPQPQDFPRVPLTLMTLLNPRALRRRRESAAAKFETAHDGWQYLKNWRDAEHDKALTAYREAFDGWLQREAAFREVQARANARLDALMQGYANGEPDAVVGHCDLALLSMGRPSGFPRYWTMSFVEGTLRLDYDLPGMDAVPVVKAVKYVPQRQGFETQVLPESERARLYGEAVLQTALAVLHTIFSGDDAGAIKAVVFNGWVTYVDGGSLRPGRSCALTMSVAKPAFQAVDLASVDPYACVRALNATFSAKLTALLGR